MSIKKHFVPAFSILFFSLISLNSCDSIGDIPIDVEDGLTQEEIVEGLKEALRIGTDTAVTRLSREDGYYLDKLVKIGLPAEAVLITDNISKIPLIGEAAVEETIKLINRAAEDAATEAVPIFVDAITSMTVEDGWNILNGSDSAATAYLRDNTFKGLFSAFMPKIETSLSKKIIGNVSAESSYSTLVDGYNTVAKLPFSGLEQITENTLSAYATRKALNGLFFKVAGEEKDIREDVNARVNDILKKVFGELDE